MKNVSISHVNTAFSDDIQEDSVTVVISLKIDIGAGCGVYHVHFSHEQRCVFMVSGVRGPDSSVSATKSTPTAGPVITRAGLCSNIPSCTPCNALSPKGERRVSSKSSCTEGKQMDAAAG